MVDIDGVEAEEVPVVKQFSFFRSIWETGHKLSDAQRYRLYDAIADFAFAGVIPVFDDDFVLDLCWTNIRPNIAASVQRSIDGSKGGRGNRKKKGALKPTSKPTSRSAGKASSKGYGKSEISTPLHSTPDSTPFHSSPSPSHIEEGSFVDTSYYPDDEFALSDEDFEF